MRKQLVETVDSLLGKDPNLVVLLGDIGVFGFRKTFESYPDRIYNIGILESTTVSVAAGLSMTGLVPVIHTIAPFLIERCVEQLKDDFGYQQLGGNFVSVGASYDYAALGCTHHCPADVGILKQIPGMEIVLPGTALEFDSLFKEAYSNGNPTYYRLSERENDTSQEVSFGKAVVIKKGSKATVIAVGPSLRMAQEACKDEDVTLLYYTTVSPFDAKTLKENATTGKVLLCEPYYSGGLAGEILSALNPMPVVMEVAGVPHTFLNNYGKAEDHDEYAKYSPRSILEHLKKLI